MVAAVFADELFLLRPCPEVHLDNERGCVGKPVCMSVVAPRETYIMTGFRTNQARNKVKHAIMPG